VIDNNENRNKKQQFYRAIGDIRDYYVAEAEATAAKKREEGRRRNYVLALVAATLSLTVIAVTIAANRTDGNQSIPQDTVAAESMQADTEAVSDDKISFLNSADCSSYSVSSVDFYDGDIKLIWSYKGSDTLYCMKLSDSEAIGIEKCQSGARRLESGEETTDLRVWICDRTGTVETPFLSQNNGNLEYGKIFDYNPEYEMTDSTLSFLTGLLT